MRKENLPDFHREQKNNKQSDVIIDNTISYQKLSLKSDEKEQIIAALNQSGGNKTLAAKLLKIDRKTLYNKMHLYNIEL